LFFWICGYILQDVNAHPPELEVPGTPYKLQAMGTMSEREVWQLCHL